MKFTKKPLALSIFLSLPMAALAQTAVELPTVTVEAAASGENPLFQPTEVGAEQIRAHNPIDLKTALADVPGVEIVDAPGTRQGNDSVNIRGLSGNRVAMDLDGIALPEAMETKFWTTQGMSFGRGNFIEPSSLSNVVIDRNAGANALGGAVRMHTLTPTEILDGRKENGYIDNSYNSVNRSGMISGAAAMERGPWRGMVLGTFRLGNETKTRGDNNSVGAERTKADPQDINSRYFLTKQEVDIDEHNTLSVTGEYLNRNQWTENLSQINAPRITSYDTKDETERTRISLGHDYHNAENPLVQNIATELYWQKAQTDAYRYSDGNGFNSFFYRPAGFREQRFSNEDKVLGVNTLWQSHIQHNGWSQDWRYGLQFAYHDLSSNWQSNYQYVTSKPFADSKRTDLSVFADDDLRFGALTVSPGLSANYYRVNPSSGNGYSQNATTQEIAPIDSNSKFTLTPRLGVAYEVDPLFVPYVQYARGVRNPSNQQLVTSFSPGFYSVLGNPNLKPETANNFTLGVRGENETLSYGVSAYNNYYRNFIDFVDIATIPGQLMTLQYQNFNKARIYGAEAHASWEFVPNWRVNGSLAYSRGHIKNDGEKHPINSVLPLKTKVGLAYDNQKWGASVDVTHAAGKKDKDLDAASGAYNPSKRYTVVDLGAYWKVSKHFSVNAGVNNVFNQKYWNWADVAYLIPNSGSSYSQSDDTLNLTRTNADRYSAPGRNFNVGFRYSF